MSCLFLFQNFEFESKIAPWSAEYTIIEQSSSENAPRKQLLVKKAIFIQYNVNIKMITFVQHHQFHIPTYIREIKAVFEVSNLLSSVERKTYRDRHP